MRYAFAIDQRTCIGCHACTVACKTEHEVPLGQFRTWVKYVDKGDYPASTREFAVLRCNHCTDAPCVRICPTNALFKRPDGIVDFDRDSCIGCKSCMQACPYDAIYIDDDTHTAAKCNFCAHRVDAGIEPACVVVCPTQSIWVGDADDPMSGISQLLATNDVAVRAPEQGTGPNVFYVGATSSTLDPLAAPVDSTYIWARPDAQRLASARDGYGDPTTNAKTTLNTAHPRPWGWRVWSYLWTKSIGAGVLLVAAIAMLLGARLGALGDVAAPAIAVVFTAATGVLLVWDLKRPERFLYILLRPNPRSWLFLGAVALMAYSAVAGAWLVAGALHHAGVADLRGIIDVLRWFAIPTAALAAGYTAFLFAQAEGRDLWQSPVLFWHLLAQAGMVGAGALLAAAPFYNLSEGAARFLVRSLVVACAAYVVLTLAEYFGRHATKGAALAARIASRGRYANQLWRGGVLPVVVAGALAAADWSASGTTSRTLAAGLLVQPALWIYESVFVRAGQDVPLS